MTRPSRPPVVGYVLPWREYGGGEIATLRVATAFARRGPYTPVAFCLEGTSVARAFEAASIDTVPFTAADFSYRRWRPYVAGVRSLAARFKSAGVDLVHCSDLMGAYQAAFAARLVGVPLLCHVRSNFPPEEIPLHHKLPLTAVDHFLFVSQSVWRHFGRIRAVPPKRGSVIYDAPPDSGTASHAPDLRGAFDVPDGATLIGMVARIVRGKDFSSLIEAFARLARERSDLHLLLVGAAQDETYAAELRDQVRHRGVQALVHWTGFRSDVPAVLRTLDIVVLATHSEGFPLIVLEAMAQRRPVVATRVGGIPEMIEDGRSGLLYADGDVEALTAHLRRLASDRAFAGALGAEGAQRVQRAFTIERTLADTSAVYERYLRRGAHAAGRTDGAAA